jgi:hypothetical protein
MDTSDSGSNKFIKNALAYGEGILMLIIQLTEQIAKLIPPTY